MSPGEKKLVQLSIIPLLIGQYNLPGVTLKDSLLNHDYTYSKFATVMVEWKDNLRSFAFCHRSSEFFWFLFKKKFEIRRKMTNYFKFSVK